MSLRDNRASDALAEMDRAWERSGLVACAWCGHTEDLETAQERWALSFPGADWCCDECFHDEDRGWPR